MKFITGTNLYKRNVHMVELEEGEDKLSDQQLINLADNGGQRPHSCSNFGGKVTRNPNGQILIEVYTD